MSTLDDALVDGKLHIDGRPVVDWERDAITGRVELVLASDVLEAAQRPPLGYVVGFKTSHGWSFSRDYGGPNPTRAGAEQEMANEVQEDPGVSWKLLEVREVQP